MSMALQEMTSYYEVLELAPDANPQEIRDAYLRVKSAYKKNSVALYTLISEEETDELLRQIEEAYQILSHPEKRKDYDRSHGLILNDAFDIDTRKSRQHLGQKIISIDRVPPMESGTSDGDILVAPSTDFTNSQNGNSFFGTSEAPLPSNLPTTDKGAFKESVTFGSPESSPLKTTLSPAAIGPTKVNIQPEIEQETEWNGSFIKRVREARNIPIEELSGFTKISKTYILAIEEENFKKLPAAVYLRGFLSQISRYLKIPSDKLIPSYLSRYETAKKD